MLELADACRRLPWAKEPYAPGGSGCHWPSRVFDTLVEQVAVRYREARKNPRMLIQRMLQLETAVRSLCEYMGWSDRSYTISQSLESNLGKEGREIALLGAAVVAAGVYQMVLRARARREGDHRNAYGPKGLLSVNTTQRSTLPSEKYIK